MSKGKIFNFFNKFLHETLFSHPFIFKGQVNQEEESITISTDPTAQHHSPENLNPELSV
jgi:hypothetical protein